MDSSILFDVSPEERIKILRENCDKIDNYTYHKKFTEEELFDIKDNVVQKATELFKLKTQKSETLSDFNTKIKVAEVDHKVLVTHAKNGFREVNEEVYLMSDQDTGMMGYYNSDGELVYKRPLKPSERQLKLTKVAN